jgi:multimeric flavodoxin WrbA
MVTILNGATPNDDLGRALRAVADHLRPNARMFELSELDIHFCTGCWSCWWKTPGRCVFRDDMDTVLPAVIESDLVLVGTTAPFGMPSPVMKKTLDRSIPLVHPYIELHHGECHHRKRYEHYPNLALYAHAEDPSDFGRLDAWIRRYSRNFHAPVVLSASQSTTPQEVADALART